MKKYFFSLMLLVFSLNSNAATTTEIDTTYEPNTKVQADYEIVIVDESDELLDWIDNLETLDDLAEDATEEEIIAAAKVVRAHDFIKELKDGYNTVVEERGSTLSAGQRQLISFARALLADPKILILDEATSSIDTKTEELLQEGLQQLLKGRTSFIIAHRLSTIKNSSQIFYISEGKIAEAGTHDELIEHKGLYHYLYQSQYDLVRAI